MLLALLPIANISLGASFNETLAWRGVREFENLLPKGRSDFVLAIRDAYSSLLRLAIAEQSKSKFVDKTPRYYQIIPELMEVFPGSKIEIPSQF